MYESMSSMAFVTGYMTTMDLQSDSIKTHMWALLRDLVHDGERFGWPTVRNFHAVWQQHIEQGDEATHLNLCRSLAWHRMARSSPPSPPPACTTQAPTRAADRTAIPCVANLEDQACVAFNHGLCSSTASRLWSHPEVHCHRKIIAPPPPVLFIFSRQPGNILFTTG